MSRISIALACLPVAAGAQTLSVQGVLTTLAGEPATDGKYSLIVSIYASAEAADPLHQEFDAGAPVEGGVFTMVLGAKAPLPLDAFSSGAAQWIGVAVQGEPELPRTPIRAVPYALQAYAATGLACSGCVQAQHLGAAVLAPYAKTEALSLVAFSGEYDDLLGGPDLSPYAKLADLAPYAMLSDLAPVATSGLYADLTGAPDPADLARRSQANTFGGANTFSKGAGFGADPAAGCAINLTAEGAGVCVEGQPARLVRLAASGADMDLVVAPGQIVYRTDLGAAFLHTGKAWRRISLVAECGDGVIDVPEQCDNGPDNADMPDACRTTCLSPECGDAIKDAGEACDKGALNSTAPDACRPTCNIAACGDGIGDTGEACDGGDLKGGTCASIKPGTTGTLTCSDACAYVTTECTAPPLTKIVMAALNSPQSGNLGGLAAADAKCQSQATAAGFAGTWKAFLSVAGERDATSLITGNNASVAVFNRSGQQMYSSWSAIFVGTNPSMASPMRTFSDVLVDNTFCADADGWTGTSATGTATGSDCSGWTTTGATGTATEIDGNQLLKQESHSCTDVLAVMCVTVAP